MSWIGDLNIGSPFSILKIVFFYFPRFAATARNAGDLYPDSPCDRRKERPIV